jgi:PAS domain S-box-containing protein
VKVVFSVTEFVRSTLGPRGPLASDPTARILHALVLALVTLLTLLTLLVVLVTPVVARLNLFLVPSLVVILVLALALLRLGFLRAASLVYLLGMFLYVTTIIVLTGGIRNAPGLVFYASLPISAAWLFGYRATLWMAGLSVSSALVLTLLDLGGVKLNPYLPARPVAAWGFLVMAILIAALPVAHVLRTLQDSLTQSQRSEQIIANELQVAQCLRHVATRSVDVSGAESPYEQILTAAMAILHADLASIQMFYPERGSSGELRLLSQRGFTAEAAQPWEWIGPDSQTTCGEALRTGERVIVPDVRSCDFMAGSEDLQAFLDAGILAAQTFPLVSRSGVLLGMVSTYWHQPHEVSESEQRALDILARLAADVIDRARAEETLSENQKRLTSIYDTVRDLIFHLAVEPDGQFRFVSVNAAFLEVTGLTLEKVVGRTVNEVIPEPSLSMVLGKYRQAIEENTTVLWEETSDYPTGRLTGEISVTPVSDITGKCTHLVGSVHDITERKRLERIAEANHKEVQALAASLMTAQEDERRRVSLELHDGMCQELGLLAVEIGNIAAHLPSPEDLPSQLRALQGSVVKASVEARNIAYQLRPPGLDELGLPIVLQDLCNHFAERAPGMALEFTSGALPESVPLEVTSCVYRVAQEGLYNTVKHSKAKHASVILTWEQGAIELTIADDGDGFDSQSVQGKGGLGLIGMEERARLVNGKLTIMSQPGSGTRIALEVPLSLAAV